MSPGVWDRLVDRLWPLTFTIGILMTVAVVAFLALSFYLVFGATLSLMLEGCFSLQEN